MPTLPQRSTERKLLLPSVESRYHGMLAPEVAENR